MQSANCVYCFGAGSIVDSAYLTRSVEHVTCSVCQGAGLLVTAILSPREAEALMAAGMYPEGHTGSHRFRFPRGRIVEWA